MQCPNCKCWIGRRSKLTPENLAAIRADKTAGHLLKQIADDHGISIAYASFLTLDLSNRKQRSDKRDLP